MPADPVSSTSISTEAMGSSSNLAAFQVMGAIAYDVDPLLVSVLPAAGSFLINVLSGTAFVYGTVTDNRTSDSAMRVATMQ